MSHLSSSLRNNHKIVSSVFGPALLVKAVLASFLAIADDGNASGSNS
jgi:hypothetical protein